MSSVRSASPVRALSQHRTQMVYSDCCRQLFCDCPFHEQEILPLFLPGFVYTALATSGRLQNVCWATHPLFFSPNLAFPESLFLQNKLSSSGFVSASLFLRSPLPGLINCSSSPSPLTFSRVLSEPTSGTSVQSRFRKNRLN